MPSSDPPIEPPPANRLAFETLISDTSASLMLAPARELDATIASTLHQVRVFFRADRCALMKVSRDRRVVNVTHAAHAEGMSPVSATINIVELFPWATEQVLEHRRPVVISRMADLPPEAAIDRARWEAVGTRSHLSVPIVSGSLVTHLIILGVVAEEREWTVAFVPRLRLLGELMVTALQRAEADQALQTALSEVSQLRDRLEHENVYLRSEVAHGLSTSLVTGRGTAIEQTLALAQQVASTRSTVLILGETGTGKERLATFIHEASPRRARHMVRVNCSAIPTALIETELFGRERGAYTGSLSRQIGRFELAQESTLFLDEIGDLSLEVQIKLLRVLQERTIERLGSPTPIPVDVRIIAATHRDLDAAVRAGLFRSDLYYRLNVFPIVMPPLRERRDDIPAMVEALVQELGTAMRKRFTRVDRASLDALSRYDWPGNVRELRNVLERAMILAPGPILTVTPPPRPSATAERVSARTSTASGNLRDLEREHILRVLHETGWRIRGKGAAAELMGIKPTTLEARMKRLGIVRPMRPGQTGGGSLEKL